MNLARSILSVLLLACALSACSPDVTVGVADYAAKIVGGWQGTVGDDADLQEVYDTERHIHYVACTRPRVHLLVTGVAPRTATKMDAS